MNILLVSLILSSLFQSTDQQSHRRRGQPSVTRSIPIELNNCPQGIQSRKEYRDLTPEEWKIFKDALLSLQTSPSPDGGKYSEWDWLTRVHLDYVPVAHDHPAFLPWHRLYVSAVEKRLQKINPSITIPYWDWSHDWASPLKSPIFSQELGLDVQLSSRGDCRYRRHFPRPHCLVRDYDPKNFTAFYPSETIDALVKSARDFDQIRQRIEWVPHGIVHSAVGGPKGDMSTMHSPNDPLFWFHHANVDRLWWNWQQTGLRNLTSKRSSRTPIDPFTDYRGKTSNGLKVQASDIITPFRLTVNQTFDSRSLCYSYASFSQWPAVPGRKRSRPSRGFFLPDPIPSSWLRMHGMNVEKVRKSESILVQLMAVQHQQQQHSILQDALIVDINENDQISAS